MKTTISVNGKIYTVKSVTRVKRSPTTIITFHTNQGDTITITTTANTKPKDPLLTITPTQVVKYFSQSPDLQAMEEDVKKALLGAGPVEEPSQFETDLQAVKHLVNPNKADIAEALTGNRYYGGQTHKRITAIYNKIYSSTPEEEHHNRKNQLAA